MKKKEKDKGKVVNVGYISDGIYFIGDMSNMVSEDAFHNRICCLKSCGYRVVDEFSGMEY